MGFPIPALGSSLFCSLALAQPTAPAVAPAHSATADPYKVVITARRSPQMLSSVLADTTVVDHEQIQRSGATSIGDLLQRQRGIEMSRNGGPGTPTNLFIRGADSRFTAVYIDGVRVDAQATGGAPWEAMALAQVDHIEIVRGPAAAIYGSDAVAGVVQIFTRRGKGPAQPYANVSIGTRHGWQAQTGVSGGDDTVDYALGVSREGSHGFDAMPDGINPDRDGWRQTTANARLGWQLNAAHRLELTGTHTRIDAQYDGFVPGVDDLSSNQLNTLGLDWTAQWNTQYSTRLSINQSEHRLEMQPEVNAYFSNTRLRNLLWHNQWQQGQHVLSADLERRDDHLDTGPYAGFARSRHQNALALGYGYEGDRHSLQANLRRDQDSEFGGQTSGSLAWGYALTPALRVSAAAGTAFRVPTLYHRFSEYGSATLQPEKSRNVEIGLRWQQGDSELGVTAWRNHIRNLIDFGPSGPCPGLFGCYANAGKAHLRGLTFNGARQVGPLHLSGSLDWQQPTHGDSGKQLARRAQRQLKLNADTQWAGWTLGAQWQLASHRWDDPGNTQRLAGYGLLNLYASTRLARDWSLLLRLDNATDRRYQLASGYAAPPLRAFAQLRWTPR